MKMYVGTNRSGQRWFALLVALAGLAVAVYLRAMTVPGSLEPDPLAIEDDARQFLTWLPRLRDPALLQDDLLADYWWSVSPPLYRATFEAAAALGLDPLAPAQLLPCVLIPLTILAAWWMTRGVLDRPEMAFFAVLLMMVPLHLRTPVSTPAPRGFADPLFLLFLGALVRDRALVMVVAIGLMAALYPPVAVTALSLLMLSRIRMSPRPGLDLSPRSLLLVFAAVGVAVAVVFPFVSASHPWQPTLTLDEARGMANFMSNDGRSRIVLHTGEIGWLCGGRIGFLPSIFSCKRPFDAATLISIAMLVPVLALLVRALRKGRAADRREVLLYGGVLLAAVVWFAIAAVLAFKLHLPSRYSQRPIRFVEMLALAQAFAVWGAPWLRNRCPLCLKAGGIAMIAIAVVTFGWPKAAEHPQDPPAMAWLAQTVPETRIGGVSDELAFVPSLLGRPVLASPEHAIPYHLGYFHEVERRLIDMLTVASTADAEEMRAILDRYGLDVFVVDRAFLEDRVLPKYYGRTIPEEAHAAVERMAARPPVLAARTAECTSFPGKSLIVLDARCLRRD